MKHATESIIKDTECNDRRCLVTSGDSFIQFNHSKNINKYNKYETESDSPHLQDFQPMEMLRELSDMARVKTTFQIKRYELSKKEKFESTSKENYIPPIFKNFPSTLIPFGVGSIIPCNGEELSDKIPTWLNREKFSRGQRFACDYLFGIFFADMISLLTLFSFKDGLKPLIMTEKSSEPYTAFTRYLSTAKRVRNWYTSDPWTKGTDAYNDIKVVNIMHENVRNKLNSLTTMEINKAAMIEQSWSPSRDLLIEDFRSSCPAPRPGQCPYNLDVFKIIKRPGLSQGDMALTQFGFFGLIILFPNAFGIYSATDEDFEALCHVWRGIGFLLGIKDEYNFCNGSLTEIKQRSRDFLNSWVIPNLRDITPECEHMMRCVTAGLQYYFPSSPFEVALLYFTKLMGIDLPRFQSSLSYKIKIRYSITEFIMKYLCRISSVRYLLNKLLNRSIDRALKFDNEKHERLREKSLRTVSMVVESKTKNSNKKVNNIKSLINMTKYSQYKLIGILMVIIQCLILWRITPFFG